MTRKTTTPYEREKKIVYAMLMLFLALLCAYMYFVSASVVNVIVRKEIDQEIASVGTHISDLETRYIMAKRELNEEHIARHGFTQVAPEKIYITKVPTSLVLVSQNEI